MYNLVNFTFAFSIRYYILYNYGRKCQVSTIYTIYPKCFERYYVDNFKIISITQNVFHLKTLKAICILSLKPDLCKQKKIFTRPFCLIRWF